MASFISGLSLLILVLINGCFTLPIGEIQFPDFTASPNDGDFTTENTFTVTTVHGDALPHISGEFPKRSENEGFSFSTETNPTVFTDVKRSSSESDNFDFPTAAGQFESSSEISRLERMNEGSLTFSEATEFSATIPEESELHHARRAFSDDDVTTKSIVKSNNREMFPSFTRDSMPLFTSTSSAVAPELYTSKSVEFNSIATSTRKYVGSLVESSEDNEEERVKDSRKDRKRPEKAAKPRDEEHREEEEEHHETVVDADEKTERPNRRPTSANEVPVDQAVGDKYIVGVLFDQDSSKYRPTLPSDFAVLDESVVPVTTKVYRSTKTTTTTKAWNEENKLNQGEESS